MKKAARNQQAGVSSKAGATVWAAFLALVLAAGTSACGVVWTTHKSRVLLNELQELEKRRNLLQVEWRRLLLEQSSLVSQGRIEDKAIAELEMVVPDMNKMVVVKGG